MGVLIMKKYVNGKCVEFSDEELAEEVKQYNMQQITERARPLTAEEITTKIIAQQINTVITDDATASRAVAFHPTLKQDPVQTADTPLVKAGTRINWKGTLKRAAADLWDTVDNNPENAPTLWEDISYRDGFRIIPETITAGLAFAEGEFGWWGDVLYRSKAASNVYTPAQYMDNWEEALA